MPHRLKIFFDGGCRPNPGAIETAVVIRGVAHIRTDHGTGYSSDAEWLALIDAVRIALTSGEDDIVFVGDSIAVVNQARGVAPCRSDSLRAHHATYRALIAPIQRVTIRHVGRSQNLAGTALERLHGRR